MEPANHKHDNQSDAEMSVSKLMTRIENLARSKDFAKAQLVREQLMELAPTALKEIIQSAEIIEKEMTAAIDKEHISRWASLYDNLNEEERNCLFYSMKKIDVPAKQNLLVHNSLNNNLYFVEKGLMAVYQQRGGKNVILARLGPGELLGEYSFCEIALCSASAASLEETQLYRLERSATRQWESTQPALMNKVLKFCRQSGHIEEIKQMLLQETTYPGHPLEGDVVANLLTEDGKKSEKYFRGGLANISRSEISFHIKCSKEKTARALLGHQLFLTIKTRGKNEPVQFTTSGKITRLTFHLYSDYTMYVQPEQILQEQLMDKIVPQE